MARVHGLRVEYFAKKNKRLLAVKPPEISQTVAELLISTDPL